MSLELHLSKDLNRQNCQRGLFELITVISRLGTFQNLLDLKFKVGISSTTFRKFACIESVLGSLNFDHGHCPDMP